MGQADSEWMLGMYSDASGGWTTAYLHVMVGQADSEWILVCIAMRLVDRPLNIIWTLMVGQADSEWILGLRSDVSGRWTTEYYLDVNDVLGGQ